MSKTPSTTSAPRPDDAGAWRRWLLDFYAKTYFSSLRMSRKLLPTGKALLGVAAASFLMIWDPSKVAMRYAFTLSLASFAVAWLLNFARAPRKLSIHRELPARALEGEVFDYVIVASNHGRFSSPPLSCRDHGRLHFPTERDWARSKPPFDDRLNAFDRWFGYPKWMWLAETRQDVIGSDVLIPPLAPGQSVRIPAQGRAGKRGKRFFLGFYCGLSDPFGILTRLFHVPSRQTLLVLPKPLHSGVEVPVGSRALQAGDARDLRRSGDSEEFRSLREWRSGDPIKHIDWKATARATAPVAREYAPEYKLRTALVFDTSMPSHLDDDCFEAAMGYAAGLVVSIDRKDRNIDMLILSDHVVSLRLGQGSQDHSLALERLASCDPTPPGSLAELEASILGSSARFSSVAMVCPSWTPAHADLARSLSARGIGLALVICSEPSGDIPPGARARVFLDHCP